MKIKGLDEAKCRLICKMEFEDTNGIKQVLDENEIGIDELYPWGIYGDKMAAEILRDCISNILAHHTADREALADTTAEGFTAPGELIGWEIVTLCLRVEGDEADFDLELVSNSDLSLFKVETDEDQ